MKSISLLALVAPLALGGCLFISETRTQSPERGNKPEDVAAAAPVARPAAVASLTPAAQPAARPAPAPQTAPRITAGMADNQAPVDTTGLTITRDVIYGHHDGMANVYDVIKPKNANGSAVLYMVSGGWVSRWAAPETRVAQFRPLLDMGITVIPIHHGSSPKFKVPDAYADVRRALRHVSLNAKSYGIDAKRLGVFGGSAGGHLTLMLALNGDDGDPAATDPVLRGAARIKTAVAYYPPVDLRRMTGPSDRFPALDFPNDQAAAISPILFVDAKDPPTLIVHGDADQLVPISSGQSIYDALKKAGVKTEMVVIKGGEHGFPNAEHRAEANKAMAAWFKANL
jgi:acetyl esterase/lipase